MRAGREYAARHSASAQQVRAHRAQFYERVWRDAAAALGAELRVLGREILEIARGDSRTRVVANQTDADDPVTLRLVNDKTSVHRLLSARALPVPRHLEFTLRSIGLAEAFMAHAAGPCVVKAARSTGAGHSVTTGIRRRSQLYSAAVHAAVYANELLIEEQVSGSVYRLLFADGRLLDTVLRRGPTVVGDGYSSVHRLVTAENYRRLKQGEDAQTLLRVDLDMKNTLKRSGLSLGSVPNEGEEIAVKTVTNDNALRDNEPANDVLCDAITQAGRDATTILGLRLAGVDIVTADPSLPLTTTGGVILEVNGSPGYHYHYHRRGGGAAVAIPILAMLLGLDRNLVPLSPSPAQST